MTDRELLEMAAKAAGIRLYVWGTEGSENFADMDSEKYGKLWNPIKDSGDALRLACDLGLRVFPIARTQSGAACSAVGSATGERLSEVDDASLDTYTATRRAIVLAAAEIGKQIKGGQHGAE